MGLLDNIVKTIFTHPLAQAQTQVPAQQRPDTSQPQAAAAPATVGSVAQAAGSAAAGAAVVDVEKVFTDLAGKSSEQLDWKNSIVDLLKLVGHDASKAAREKLADELHYPGDKSDSAAMNDFLHKAVLKEIAANGGKLPSGLGS